MVSEEDETLSTAGNRLAMLLRRCRRTKDGRVHAYCALVKFVMSKRFPGEFSQFLNFFVVRSRQLCQGKSNQRNFLTFW
jgi:hypothetical protein